LVTIAVVPRGKVVLAATSEFGLKRLPSPIFRLTKWCAYMTRVPFACAPNDRCSPSAATAGAARRGRAG
jgi:hypothetical protein